MNNLLDLRTDAYETSDIMNDVKQIIDDSRNAVYKTIDIVLLQRNWLIGKRIYEEELKETRKENYGREIIVNLSKELTRIYGKGFDQSNLYNYLKFYKLYQKIFDSVCQQSFLSWTHYRILIKIDDAKTRNWYEKEAYKNAWSVRTLQRNISTQYYYRMLSSQVKEHPDYVSDDVDYFDPPPECPNCGQLLNPFGHCPVCDYGEYDLVDNYSAIRMLVDDPE